VQTTTRSPGPNPCETKSRAYFPAYRSQSSQVRKKLFGIPLVPEVSLIVKTASQGTLLKQNSPPAGAGSAGSSLPR